MTSVQELQGFLSEVITNNNTPTNLSFFYYILAKEFNLSLSDIQELPIPYLSDLIDTHQYIKEEEIKESKKKR